MISEIQLQWNPSIVDLGLSEVALIEGCPHVRGGLFEGLPQ